MNYTEEQLIFVKTGLKGDNIACSSFAGTGKSFILFLYFRYAKQKKPNRKHLLLSFNRHLQKEYEQSIKKYKLSDTVETKTLHVLAKRNTIDTGYVYVGDSKLKIKKPKLTSLHGYDLLKNCKYSGQAWEIYKEFYAFNTSTDDWNPLMVEIYTNLLNKGLCSHDMYVKLFQLELKHKYIDLSKQYDCVVLDECLTADTMIDMGKDRRSIPIKSIVKKLQNGETVFVNSYNTKTGEFEMKKACNPLISENRDVYEVKTFGVSKFKATPNHKMLTNRGWVRVDELKQGDILLRSNPNNQKTQFLLNSDQEQVLLGSAFGDGHLDYMKSTKTKRGINPYALRLCLTQGEKQKDYLSWKASSLNCGNLRKIASGYTKKETIYTTSSKVFIYDTPITLDVVLERIQPLGLAVWFMDDASYHNKQLILNSNNLTYSENLKVVNMFKTRFNIDCGVYSDGKGYYNVSFNRINAKKLITLIKPYIHKDLEYKFGVSNEYKLDNKFRDVGGEAVYSVEYVGKETVYDFEVEDNHSFLISKDGKKNGSRFISHNCQDSTQVLYNCFINSGVKQKIGVGDVFQDLYSFLTNDFNAVVELLKTGGFTNLNLSKTFRCSHKIASTVNQALLKPYMNSTVDYIGTEEPDLTDDSVLIVTVTNSDVLLQAYVNARQGIKYSLAATVKELSSELIQVYIVSVIKKHLESATMKNLKQVEALLSDLEQTYRDKGSNFIIEDALSKEIKKDLVGYYWYKKRNNAYDLSVIEYLKTYSQLKLKGSITLLGKIRKMKLTVFDFIKIIRKYRDPKSKLMISNCHRVKGLTKGTVILYNWVHPDEYIKDLYVKYSRLVTQDKISSKDFEQLENNAFYDLNIGVKYSDIRNYIQYVNMLYVAITRARHTVITSNCKGLDIFNIQH